MGAKKIADFDPNWTFSDCNSSLNSPMALKLDESTARRYLKSSRSLSGRSLHLTFQGHGQGQIWLSLRPSVHAICLLLILWQSNHLWLSYSKFQIRPWKLIVKVMARVKSYAHNLRLRVQSICLLLFRGNRTIFGRDIAIPYMTLKSQGQCHGQGQILWSHLRLRVQSICLLLVSWQLDHFWLRYSEFHIWPWKFKVMAKLKFHGHIWGSEFNQYVRFLFHGNRTLFGWDIANSIFDLEKSRSRSRPRSNPMVTFEAQSSIDIFAFCFVAIRPFWAEI